MQGRRIFDTFKRDYCYTDDDSHACSLHAFNVGYLPVMKYQYVIN